MTLGHTIGIALGAIAAMLAAFASLAPTDVAARYATALAAACAAGSTYLQYQYPPGAVASPTSGPPT